MPQLKIESVTAVLLADGWHIVRWASFEWNKTSFTETHSGDINMDTATWQEDEGVLVTARRESILALKYVKDK